MKNTIFKYHLIVLLLVGFNTLTNAQSFMNIEVGQNFSTFRFSSKFIEDVSTLQNQQYSQISSISYGAGYTNLRSSGLLLSGGLGFRKAGASLVYNKTSFLWDLQYIDFKLGVGYLFNRWSVKPYVALLPYYAYLLNAKQSNGLKFYDIKADNALKNYDLGLLLNIGLKVPLSYYTDLFAEYNYNVGLNNIETAPDQFLYNRGFAVKLGIAINITNFRKLQEQINNTNTNFDNGVPSQNSSSETIPNNTNSDASPPPIIGTGTQGWAVSSNNSVNKSSTNDNSPKDDNAAPSGDLNTANNSNVDNTNSIKNTENIVQENKGVSNNTEVNNNTVSSSKSTSAKNEPDASQPVKNADKLTVGANQSSTTSVENDNKLNTKDSKPSTVNLDNKKNTKKDNQVEFKIQLTAVKNSLTEEHPIYKNFKGGIKAEKGKDGWMRYYLGSYKTYEEALKELRKFKGKGLAEGGFIVAFKDAKKVSVSEAKEFLNK